MLLLLLLSPCHVFPADATAPEIPVQTSTLSARIKLLSPRSYESNSLELTPSLDTWVAHSVRGRRHLAPASRVSRAACVCVCASGGRRQGSADRDTDRQRSTRRRIRPLRGKAY